MILRFVVTLQLFFILSICVTSSKGLPQRKESSPKENEKCNQCEDAMKTGTTPFNSLWTLKKSIGADLPSENLSDKMLLKSENIKRAEALFLEFCKLNCKKFMDTPDENLIKMTHFSSSEEKEKLTKLAEEEFRKPRMAIENKTDSDPMNNKKALKKEGMKGQSLNKYSNDGAPFAETRRSLTNLENQTSTSDPSEVQKVTLITTTQPEWDTPSHMSETTKEIKITPVVSEAKSNMTKEHQNPTTNKEKKTNVTKPVTKEHKNPTANKQKMKPEGNFNDIDTSELLDQLEDILSNGNIEELLNNALYLINDFNSSSENMLVHAAVNLAVALVMPLFFRKGAGNSSTVGNSEEIFDDLEDYPWPSGLDSGNGGTSKDRNYANKPSRVSSHGKSSRSSGTKEISTPSDLVEALSDYLQWRFMSKKQNENQ